MRLETHARFFSICFDILNLYPWIIPLAFIVGMLLMNVLLLYTLWFKYLLLFLCFAL